MISMPLENVQPGPPSIREVILGASLVATREALRKALKEIYELKGGGAKRWLDNFERGLIAGAKDMVGEGVAMEDELKIINGVIANIRSTFTELRNELFGETKR
jgi:hypothetical protein